jgi:hypothetical protein
MHIEGIPELALHAPEPIGCAVGHLACFEGMGPVERAARTESHGGGSDAESEALYARAVALDPTNERAREGLAATRERLGLVVAPETSPLIERSRREMTAKRQEVMFRFEALLEAARDGIASGRPDGFQAARLHLDRANPRLEVRVRTTVDPALETDTIVHGEVAR